MQLVLRAYLLAHQQQQELEKGQPAVPFLSAWLVYGPRPESQNTPASPAASRSSPSFPQFCRPRPLASAPFRLCHFSVQSLDLFQPEPAVPRPIAICLLCSFSNVATI